MLKDMQPGEDSATIRERVVKARAIQAERFAGTAIHCNAQMTPKMVRQYCQIDSDADLLLETAMTKQGLSARAYDRILKVARTIADLSASPNILKPHIFEAISYRQLDKMSWGD